MELIVDPQGQVRCLYVEAIDLAALGPLTIRRASQVEPDASGSWWADLAPVGGPQLGPYPQRSAALAAESAWLTTHHLLPRAAVTTPVGQAEQPFLVAAPVKGRAAREVEAATRAALALGSTATPGLAAR